MLKKLKSIFSLPTPYQLGMTKNKNNALAIRHFNNTNELTWEDWRERVQKEYPIKYMLSEDLMPWLRKKYKQYINEPIYWIKCHTISKYKYHLIDIREPLKDNFGFPPTKETYRYGWIDADTKMIFALFKIFNDFVEKEMKDWYIPSDEDIQTDVHLITQRNTYLEIKAIHYRYNIERKRNEKISDDLLSAWSHSRNDTNERSPLSNKLWNDLKNQDEINKKREEEMIERLLKIRKNLWA